MIFNAKEIHQDLKRLLDRITCPFKISLEVLNSFKERCQKLGFKNHSPVLEAILIRFNEYSENTPGVTLLVKGRSDRVQTSFSCSNSVWKDFNKQVKAQGVERVQLLEFLMDDFNQQARKIKN